MQARYANAPCPMPNVAPLRYRPTLAEVRGRVVSEAIARADYSRGKYAGQRGTLPAGSYSAAFARGWVDGACC